MGKLKLRVFTREVEHEGETFIACKTATKNGKKKDLKFRREVENAPKDDCFIIVDEKNINLESENASLYPAVWVHKIDEIVTLQDELTPEAKAKLEEMFGSFEEEDQEEDQE